MSIIMSYDLQMSWNRFWGFALASEEDAKLAFGPPKDKSKAVARVVWNAFQALIATSAFIYAFSVSSEPAKFMVFLTSWGLFLAAFAYNLQIVGLFIRFKSKAKELLIHEKALITLLNALATLSVLITAFYWLQVFPGLSSENQNRGLLDKLIGHGLIPILVILDLAFFSTRPLRWQHFWHAFLIGGLYLIFSFGYHELGGKGYKTHVKDDDLEDFPHGYPYIYKAVNWEEEARGTTWTLVGVITAAIIVIHLGLFSLHRLFNLRCCKAKQEDETDEKFKDEKLGLVV